ncbi:MAG TPA: TRAP transporter small permease subunit [Usitatibacter sp.]|nr:TRAP transporter small permease subunit [Usitatibacter sp.]
MRALRKISALIDALNDHVGRLVYWLVLAMVLISAGNAIIRKVFSMSSNAWLELQWYLFSAVFLLAAGYTLLRNEHVRIDIIVGRLSARTQAWIEIFGTVFFLLPMAILIGWLSWPYFVRGYTENEISGSAGGLTLWPARLLLPVGFLLLTLQGISELIKRIAFLANAGPDPVQRHDLNAEAKLAEEIRRMAEGNS